MSLLGGYMVELRRLKAKYKAIQIQCESIWGALTFPVDRKPFERYTKCSEDNSKLRDFRAFVGALERLSKHTHIYIRASAISYF